MNLRLLIWIVVLSVSGSVFSQQRGDLRIMFYNTENFFDTDDNPHTNDNDFLPGGIKHWSPKKYKLKLQNLSKVITALGEWSAPDIVALCEVENRFVLSDLIQNTPLSNTPYSISHFESPDKRGIDVALLYRRDKLTLLEQKPIEIHLSGEPGFTTRDILLVKLAALSDTFYVFVNHWPSRVGGELKSSELRCAVADQLKLAIDSLFQLQTTAKIIIMGDFNDEPMDNLKLHLMAYPIFSNVTKNALYNLSSSYDFVGTHKFQGRWFTFDQIIVSGSMLISKGMSSSTKNVHVFQAPFVLEPDETNLGYRLFSTYSGPKYKGGYSDHLPVFIDLFVKTE